jgi:hypothetical protein
LAAFDGKECNHVGGGEDEPNAFDGQADTFLTATPAGLNEANPGDNGGDFDHEGEGNADEGERGVIIADTSIHLFTH